MPTHKDRRKDLFQRALDLPEAERRAFVARECAGLPDGELLAEEVQALLSALDEAGGFLGERPWVGEQGEGPGDTIDRYCLIERIGEGGFGVVYRAEQQQPLRREVALKILKLGMDSRAVVRRFERERQVLARMQHPGIAAVFDAGTTPAGRPYFVMELVDGLPISRYCKEHGLGIDERAELLWQVCMCVQHAHQKGIAHRDLKPGNILVTAGDHGQVQPKVIDFGIAKALDDDDGRDGDDPGLSATRVGQAIGTLEYMAPEQAAGDHSAVDSRADVYSLGVVLYELLTGRRPFERSDPTSPGTVEVVRRIREDVPARASQIVAGGEIELPLRGADRQRWCRRLGEGLDWIVARALAKDPARRYATPNAMATDLRCFLDGLPVAAGPPDAWYQLRCFVARHRVLVGAAALLFLSLVVGFVATSMALSRAYAETRHKEHTLAAMRQMLLTADPQGLAGPDYKVRDLLTDFGQRIDARFAEDVEVAFDLHVTVGAACRNLAQDEAAARHLGRAIELLAEGSGRRDAASQALAWFEWAAALRALGRLEEADAAFDAAIDLRRRAGRDERDVAEVWLHKADLLRLRDQTEAGEALARRALAVLGAEDGDAEQLANRAFGLDLLGAFAQQRGDVEAAHERYAAALELRKRCMPAEHPVLATSWFNLADVEARRGNFEAAGKAIEAGLAVHRASVGEQHPRFADGLAMRGGIALRRGDLTAARADLERAQQIRAATLPAGHPELASGLADLARLALAERQPAAAEGHLRAALAVREQAGATKDRSYAALWGQLGVAVMRQERAAEAVPLFEKALALHRALGGGSNPGTAATLHDLALAMVASDRAAAALPLLHEAVQLRLGHRADDLDGLLAVWTSITRAAAAAGDDREHAAALAARVALLERRDEDPQRLAAIRSRAARALLDLGQVDEARPMVEAAHAYCLEHMPTAWPRGECASLLSECHAALGDWSRAMELAEEAVATLRGSPAPDDRVQRAEHNLERARSALAGGGR